MSLGTVYRNGWIVEENHCLSLNLDPLMQQNLRKEIMAKLKGNRSCRIDFVDGYSVKLAAPILERVLFHLVNLNIEQSKFPQLCKSTILELTY